MRALSRAGGKDCLVYRTTEKKQQKEMKVKQKPSGMLSPVCMQCESELVVRWVLTVRLPVKIVEETQPNCYKKYQ